MHTHYSTIDANGNTIETFHTTDPEQVKPLEDFHQIIRIEPKKWYRLITRYDSLYDLLAVPF